MDNSEVRDSSQCVRVAVNVRPLITSELLIDCTDCITEVPGETQSDEAAAMRAKLKDIDQDNGRWGNLGWWIQFLLENFTVIFCHYNGNVNGWRDLDCSNKVDHIAAQNKKNGMLANPEEDSISPQHL